MKSFKSVLKPICTKTDTEIVPIDSNNVNFYQWGLNCRKLGFTVEQTEDAFYTEAQVSSEDFDMFWSGYYS